MKLNRYWFYHVTPPSWNGIKIMPATWEGWSALAAVLIVGLLASIWIGLSFRELGPGLTVLGSQFLIWLPLGLLIWKKTDHSTSRHKAKR